MEPSNGLLIFFVLTTFLYPSLTAQSSSNELSLRLDLTHVDAGLNLTVHELLRRAAARSKARLARLTMLAHLRSENSKAPIYWGPEDAYEGEYLVEFGVGIPPRYLPFILDTGSTLVWTQCEPCSSCEKQPVPLFDPRKSSTFSRLSCSSKQCAALGSTYGSNCSASKDCHFDYGYADGSETIGYIGSETVTFRYLSEQPLSVQRFAIGCARLNEGSMASSSGTAGFGRSPESLISQLGVTRFSYCFIPYIPQNTKRSPLLLGAAAVLRGPAQSTPLLKDDLVYYVSLEGITVGSARLPFGPSTFARKDGSGGTIFDSGTFNTNLITVVFTAVKKAFVSAIKLPVSKNQLSVDYELCFDTPRGFSPKSFKIPKLVLHFKGADMDLPRENYVVYDAKNKLICVLIEDGGDLNIVGNFYQQNMHLLYDLKKERLSFGPAQCDRQ